MHDELFKQPAVVARYRAAPYAVEPASRRCSPGCLTSRPPPDCPRPICPRTRKERQREQEDAGSLRLEVEPVRARRAGRGAARDAPHRDVLLARPAARRRRRLRPRHRCTRYRQIGHLRILAERLMRRGIGRLIDSYAEGIIDKAEFEPRIAGLKQRLSQLEERHQAALETAESERDLSLVISRLEDFSAR
jgi:hypothetical protein